jgi:hypothetical protein
LLNGKVYRITGQITGGTKTTSVDIYNPATTSWSSGPTYPQATYFLATTALNGGIYGAGGGGDADLEKTYRLDPTTGTWDDAGVPDLPQTRWGATSGVLNGKWLLAGGNENGTVTSSALLWNGATTEGWKPLPPMLVPRHRLGGAAVGSAFFAVGGEDSSHNPTTDVQAYIDPCPMQFSDVTASDYFYTPVLYLACQGVIGGYSDGTFRPYNNTTRGQLAKIVGLGFGLPAFTPPSGATFADVPNGSTFWGVIEAAAHAGVVSGYACGGANPVSGAAEPCDSLSRPYYRPANLVTRAQLSKIVVLAAGWAQANPPTPTFNDVAPGSSFYGYIEAAVSHGIINGYTDGTFRPGNSATRGQISKIVYRALTGATASAAK